MSRFDRVYDDDKEEELLRNRLDSNEEVEKTLNSFDKELLVDYTIKEHKEYLDFLLGRVKESDKINKQNKFESQENLFYLLKKHSFQACKSSLDKIKFLVNYLKQKYIIITPKIFKDFTEEFQLYEDKSLNTNQKSSSSSSESDKFTITENTKRPKISPEFYMTEEEFKYLFIMNFNKETVNLNNSIEEDDFIKFMFDLLSV